MLSITFSQRKIILCYIIPNTVKCISFITRLPGALELLDVAAYVHMWLYRMVLLLLNPGQPVTQRNSSQCIPLPPQN